LFIVSLCDVFIGLEKNDTRHQRPKRQTTLTTTTT
jgi:hypothetical protein